MRLEESRDYPGRQKAGQAKCEREDSIRPSPSAKRGPRLRPRLALGLGREHFPCRCNTSPSRPCTTVWGAEPRRVDGPVAAVAVTSQQPWPGGFVAASRRSGILKSEKPRENTANVRRRGDKEGEGVRVCYVNEVTQPWRLECPVKVGIGLRSPPPGVCGGLADLHTWMTQAEYHQELASRAKSANVGGLGRGVADLGEGACAKLASARQVIFPTHPRDVASQCS